MLTKKYETRKSDKGIAFPVIVLYYNDVAIAVFKGGTQEQDLIGYIQSHRYLAKWSAEWMQGKNPSWSDEFNI